VLRQRDPLCQRADLWQQRSRARDLSVSV
jgi:hypothetical protein